MDKNIILPYIRVAMYSTLPNGCVIGERVIYDYEIIYVKDGSCLFYTGGNEYRLRKNQVVFIRPGIPHRFVVKNEEFVQPHIHFDLIYNHQSTKTPVSFKNFGDMTDYEKSLVTRDELEELEIPPVFEPSNTTEFQKVFFEVIDCFSAKKQNYQLRCKAELLRLLEIILLQFEKEDTRQDNTVIIRTVKDYIDGNFTKGITLDALAMQFFMNKFTMMRQFRSCYGINIMEYCNQKRLDKAKQMLLHTNLTVKCIGDELGFTDSYSFSRFFKNAVGMSPLKFRNLALTTNTKGGFKI